VVNSNFEYLIVLGLSLLFPFLLSFHPRSQIKNRVLIIIITIILVSIPWVIWDIYATYRGHWEFNSNYVLGPKIFNLPIEELAFFYVIPYCCLFLWNIVREFKDWPTFFNDLMNKK
jgi:lycopene cyclase domain-containing protein